ncbi:MAG: ABC transporter ATP-binding protein [Pseudomonadota bacterium]
MNLAFLAQRASPYRKELGLICLITLLGSMATLLVPWLAGRLLGGLLGEFDISLTQTVALLVAALLAMAALNIGVSILSELASGRILAGLRFEAYEHVQSMPIEAHEQADLGDWLALVTYEIKILSTFLTSTLATLPSNLFTAVGAMALLFILDPTMALIVPILVPIYVIVFKLTGRRLKRLSRLARNAEVDVFAQAETDLEVLPAVKSFAQEDAYRANYAQKLEAARLRQLAQTRVAAFVGPVTSLFAGLCAIAILIVGTTGLSGAEDQGPSDLFAFLFYAALLTMPAGNLARLYGEFQWVSGTLSKLSEVLATPREEGYAMTTGKGRANGAIAFEDVRFSYPGRSMVLDGVSLSVEAGEVVALTGPNGVGKSTLVRLLMRFYEPLEGRITLDGEDVRNLNVQHLRRQIGYVPQRALLFNGSVADNISMRAPGATKAAIRAAADLSGAADFIDDLPHGLDTIIGDKGIRLSGGQGQRVALARALFADPPIYIFDEATSMYDIPSEVAFVETCIKALKGRTIILITHRPATLALADRVLVASSQGFQPVAKADVALMNEELRGSAAPEHAEE